MYETKFKETNKIKCIIGDFDGLREEVKAYYQSKDIDMVHDADQNTTDFEKTLNYAQKRGFKELIFFNFYPGRIDHVLAAMSNT